MQSAHHRAPAQRRLRPYTGIKTNLLFFNKGEATKEVWFYEHPYPPGYKSYSKTKPMRIEEFDAEKAWWNDRKETAQAWKVSAEDIRARGFNPWRVPEVGERTWNFQFSLGSVT